MCARNAPKTTALIIGRGSIRAGGQSPAPTIIRVVGRGAKLAIAASPLADCSSPALQVLQVAKTNGGGQHWDPADRARLPEIGFTMCKRCSEEPARPNRFYRA